MDEVIDEPEASRVNIRMHVILTLTCQAHMNPEIECTNCCIVKANSHDI